MIATVTDLVITDPTGRRLVDQLNFTLSEGEILALTGRSGSGKTTAALSLLGHLRPNLTLHSGRVEVSEVDMFASPRAIALRGQVIRYLPQDPKSSLNPAHRLRTHLAETGATPTRITSLLTDLNLPTTRRFLRRYPHQLSGGQAQRLAFALALASPARLLILDEPTSGLDPALATDFRTLLTTHLRQTQAAALLISHDATLVADLATTTISLDRRPPGPTLPPRRTDPRPPAPPRLTVHNLTAAYTGPPVFTDLSFALAAGECLALVGPSGAGKTTLARCLVGLHRPSRGTITLHSPTPPRRAIALVAQDSLGALNPRETVRVALSRPQRRPRADRSAEVDKLLCRVHLDPALATQRPAELSGGERQRVNLARALAADPEVLVCDEITSALDPTTREAILDLLEELRTTLGLAIVLISHDQGVVDRMADRVLRLG